MIKRALISVSDKSGIAAFAAELEKMNIQIISTGGTETLLRNENISVTAVSDITGFPECLDGRVKTLHPNVHAGILAVRDSEQHTEQLSKLEIETIDLVVVNLYPFKKTILAENCTFEDAIENIDIGGPTMLRAAAKNFRDVTVVTDPADYMTVLSEIKADGDTSYDTRLRLARKVFHLTAYYDALIDEYLKRYLKEDSFEENIVLAFDKSSEMRYGENPHQPAAYYTQIFDTAGTVSSAEQLWGKELSYNNIQDANAAAEIIKEFPERACAVNVKHANPCAVAAADTISEAYKKAFDADPVSIFGGIVALNRTVSKDCALLLNETFLEIVIAPDYEDEALELLKEKKNLRILKISGLDTYSYPYDAKKVLGGLLIQKRDEQLYEHLNVVTEKKPGEKEMQDLLFAYRAVKHTKSNAVSVCKDSVLIGNGPGQTNRVGALKIALEQAGDKAAGAVIASDAFFPFSDCVEMAEKASICAIIQPGGSVNDEESINKCNEYGISMIFTGTRHFRH